jgi:hypothetical protein
LGRERGEAAKLAAFSGSQTVAIGDQDHGRVAMPVAAMLSSAVHQLLDLALGEIASFDCQIYDAWCAFFGCRFHRNKTPILEAYWLSYTPLLNSQFPNGEVTGSAARR